MKITVCIPAYNESQIIEQTLRTIKDFCLTQPKYKWNIIVADNNSDDETAKFASRVPDVSIITVATQGKGAAIIATAKIDDGDIFCFIDADLSATPNSLTGLINSIERGSNIAIGSRLLDTSQLKRSYLRTLSSQIFNSFRKLILGTVIVDSQCGLKAFDSKGRDILLSCTETGWFFDMELLTKAERSGLVIHEISIPWQETVYPGRESKLNVLRDGVKGFLAMIRIRYKIDKKNLWPLKTIPRLLLIGAFVYFGIFFWHTSAVLSTGSPIESMYFERGDATGYVEMANSILNNDYSLIVNDESARGLRTPGYPIFLASIFSFSRNPLLVVVMQIFIALATIPLIYQIGLHLTNSRISFLATLAYIIYPTTAFLNTQILTETVFMFFATLAIWLLLVVVKSKAFTYAALGIVSGVATLVRPSFLYIIPFIIAYLVISEKNIWQKIIRSGIVLIAIFIILSPWIHANQRDYGHSALSTAGNYNILYVYIPLFLTQNNDTGKDWLAIRQNFVDMTEEAGYKIGSHRASNFESEQIKSELQGQQLSYIIFHIKRSVLTFLSSGLKMLNNELTELGKPIFSATPWLIQQVYTYGLSWDLIKNNLLAFIDAGMMTLVTALMPISLIVAVWRGDKNKWGLMFLFCMIMMTVLMAGPIGNARYRMPIQPFIFLLAFSSIFIIIQFLKNYFPTKTKAKLL